MFSSGIMVLKKLLRCLVNTLMEVSKVELRDVGFLENEFSSMSEMKK